MGIMDRMMETQLGKMTANDRIAMMRTMHGYMFSKLTPETKSKVLRDLVQGLKGGK